MPAAFLRLIAIVLAATALSACADRRSGQSGADLQAARRACNEQYPKKIGLYLHHARCVNDAVERYALPGARYPDLIRLQESVRAALSARIDRRKLSPELAERKMAEADSLLAQAERDRNADDEAGANRRMIAAQAIARR